VREHESIKVLVEPSGDWRVTNTGKVELGISITDGERRCRALLGPGETRTFTGLTRRAEAEILEDVSSFRGSVTIVAGHPGVILDPPTGEAKGWKKP